MPGQENPYIVVDLGGLGVDPQGFPVFPDGLRNRPFKGVGSGQPGMALQGPGIQGQGLPVGSQGLVKIASLLLGASEGQMKPGIILAIPSRPSGSG